MSREVRRVPQNWEHPKNAEGSPIPLYGGSFSKYAAEYDAEEAQWEKGLYRSFEEPGRWEPKKPDMTYSFVEWHGERHKEKDYMPDWPEHECTHFQMYEATTEGTPISPVMETPEALARWLSDNRASAGAHSTLDYEGWLMVIRAGSTAGTFTIRFPLEMIGPNGEIPARH